MELGLRHQTAAVIGAARGIGRAIAEAFAAEGCDVRLFDRDPAVLPVARQISEAYPDGGHIDARTLDAGDFPSVLERAEERNVEHVVYAAGMGSGKYGFPFWNLVPDDWDAVLRVNLMGAVHTAHAFTPGMVTRRRGTLLFLSSIAGQIGSQTDPPYSAAKAAVINFAQCAAKDLAPYDVRVNTICPGMIKTNVNQAVWEAWNRRQENPNQVDYEQWAEEKISRVTPLGRWQTVEDVAHLAVFLASPLARNITGQTLNVDGGQVMR